MSLDMQVIMADYQSEDGAKDTLKRLRSKN
jgi:hypothetical protein